MSNQPIISVKNVKRTFKSTKTKEGLWGSVKLLVNPEIQVHEALKGISFDIEEGTFNGLIGANGAGKTTLLKILSGLIPPSSGEARVLGYEPFTRPLEFRKQISLVMGQKAQLWWDLPGIDAFDLLQAIYEIPENLYKERLNSLAELLDVKKMLHTQIRRLSLGERMKMELIGALLHWPKVIFLDEPTIGLDVLAAQNLREFLRVFNQKEKATIILTSHNMDDIQRLCTRVLIVRSGELLFDGKPQGLMDDSVCQLKVMLASKPSVTELSQATGVDVAQISFESLEEKETAEEEASSAPNVYFSIKRDRAVNVLSGLMTKFKVLQMGFEEQSLESVIKHIYQEEKSR